MTRSETSPHFFGVRHHGPGCARSLVRALEDLQPDCLLVEGPPEGQSVLALLSDPELVPPVALLSYSLEDARQATFYPLAEFSPEWNALRFASQRGIETRFIDLPAALSLPLLFPADEEAATSAQPQPGADGEPAPDPRRRSDPLDWLGRAAGYGDGESWWNHMVEERGDSLDLFAAIREAMTVVREEAPSPWGSESAKRREALREAHMRKCLRQARKDSFERIAVVCGAWHVSALAPPGDARADEELLKGLPRIKVEATWVPWSYRNLSMASGYGAGVSSPGWYEHLWRVGEGSRATGWLARAAALFRSEGIDCSSAHVISAVRLAEALAAVRERPQPGLEELNEALRSVVCMGEEGPMRVIARRLIVGDRIGTTPDRAPTVPLQRDLSQQQKSLRLKPEAAQKTLDLDLRQANDLARSHLLHRCSLLGIGWGALDEAGRGAKGSFHEIWTLQWDPQMAVEVIEACRWGNTVEQAANAKAIDRANSGGTLDALARLVNEVLLADLADAIGPVTQALEDVAALSGDVGQMLGAIPPLANIARYGNVRQTDTAMVQRLLHGLVPRAAIALPGACQSIDDEAASVLRDQILNAHGAMAILASEELHGAWRPALLRVADREGGHGLTRGLAARLLFDEKIEDIEATSRRVSRALSQGSETAPAAAWLEGFLHRGGLVVLHDDALWSLVDGWLAGLGEDHFRSVLPLLRRAFSGFAATERRQLGERARRPAAAGRVLAREAGWNEERARRALPLLRSILGVPR